MMKKLFITILFAGLSANISAQIDRSTKTNTVKGLGIPAETTNSLSIPKRTGLSNPNPNGLLPAANDPFYNPEEKKPINLTTDNGLMQFKQEGFTPKAFKDKDATEAHKKDQDLGDVKTGGEFVEVYCRDHEFVDGDKVRIIVNGEVIYNSLSLVGRYSPILVKLKDGFNTIEFEALNQGSSGPNTAELKVLDDIGQPLAKNEWNLLTGAKANIIVVKE